MRGQKGGDGVAQRDERGEGADLHRQFVNQSVGTPCDDVDAFEVFVAGLGGETEDAERLPLRAA